MTISSMQEPFTTATNSDSIELLGKYETPFYTYDLKILQRQFDDFQAAFPFPWFHLYFATMANDRASILSRLASLGVGACVNSINHLELALDCGFSTEKIQFSSTGVTRSDMKRLIEHGVHLNSDSLDQVEQWIGLGGKDVGLRINAASLSSDRPKDRIGMSLEDANSARLLAIEKSASISTLHVYIGTNLQSHKKLLPTVAGLFRYAENFQNISRLNIGGGVGVNYEHQGDDFDLDAYGSEVSKCQEHLRRNLGRSVEVIVEPGRKLTASCGKMFTRVTDVKKLHGKRFVTVDASIAVFPRPFHHPESPHRIRHISYDQHDADKSSSECVIAGRTTFSRDILGKAILPDSTGPNDVLVFDDAGSYCQSMESRFLGQRTPAVVLLNEEAN